MEIPLTVGLNFVVVENKIWEMRDAPLYHLILDPLSLLPTPPLVLEVHLLDNGDGRPRLPYIQSSILPPGAHARDSRLPRVRLPGGR
jgi:hypothetical protein